MKTLLIAAIVGIGLCLPLQVKAVSITLDQVPEQISDGEFSIRFTVKGAKAATNYFKVLLYKDGTRSYLANTWNGRDWYDGPETSRYFSLSVTGDTVSGEVKGKIVTPIDSGEYLLSVKRYTSSGNAASDSITPAKVKVETKEQPKPTNTPVIQSPSPSLKPVSTPLEVISEETLSDKDEPLQVLAVATMAPTNSPVDIPSVSIKPQMSQDNDQSKTVEYTLAAMLMLCGFLSIILGSYLLRIVGKTWYNQH